MNKRVKILAGILAFQILGIIAVLAYVVQKNIKFMKKSPSTNISKPNSIDTSQDPFTCESLPIQIQAKGTRSLILYHSFQNKVLKQLNGPSFDLLDNTFFTPDGSRIVSLGYREWAKDSKTYALILCFWDVSSGAFLEEKQIRAFKWPGKNPPPSPGVMWLTDGKMGFTFEHKTYFYDVNASKLLGYLDFNPNKETQKIGGQEFGVESKALTHDEKQLFSLDSYDVARKWSLDHMKEMTHQNLAPGDDRIDYLYLDPKEKWLIATSREGGHAIILNAETLEIMVRFGPKNLPLPTQEQLLSDNSEADPKWAAFREWNTKTSDSLSSCLKTREARTWDQFFVGSQDGRYAFVRGSGDDEITGYKFIDNKENRLLSVLHLSQDPYDLSPTGSILLMPGLPANLTEYDPALGRVEFHPKGRPKITWQAHQYAITDLAVCPESKTLVTVCEDWTVRAWDIQTSAEKAVLSGKTINPSLPVLSQDGRYLALNTGKSNDIVQVWDLKDGSLVRSFQETAYVKLFHPTKPWLIAGPQCVDYLTGHRVESLPEVFVTDQHKQGFSPDGKHFAYLKDKRVCICDGETFAQISQLPLPEDYGDLLFSADGKSLWWLHNLAGSSETFYVGDGLVWDTQTWKSQPWSFYQAQVSAPDKFKSQCPFLPLDKAKKADVLSWFSNDLSVKIRCGGYWRVF